MRIVFDSPAATVIPTGPVLTRRMSSLEGLFEAEQLRRRARGAGDPVVYTVASSPVPELPRELPQSITTIPPGTLGGEFYMTKGHQHPDPQGEIYLCLRGTGGLLTFDGTRTSWIEMTPGVIGYMPPGWAHRSVNTGDRGVPVPGRLPRLGRPRLQLGRRERHGRADLRRPDRAGPAPVHLQTPALRQAHRHDRPTRPGHRRVLVTSRSFSTGTRNLVDELAPTASPC